MLMVRFVRTCRTLISRMGPVRLMARLVPIALIRLYQWTIRPFVGPRCRYEPHCSEYGIEAFRRHGLFTGAWLTAHRLCRCHPWAGTGIDPVPEKLSWPRGGPTGQTPEQSMKSPSTSTTSY